MGCCGSTPKHSVVDTSGWTNLFINYDSGDVSSVGKDGTTVGEVLASCAIAELQGGKKILHHWVQDRRGATWTETKLGGTCTFSCLTTAEFDPLWKTAGGKGTGDGGELAVKDGEAGLDEVPITARPSELLDDKAVKTAYMVGTYMAACGKAEFGDKVYLLTGEINDRINMVDQKTGKVCLSMSQWRMGIDVKFYTKNVDRLDRASVRKDKQASKADAAFCGLRKPEAGGAKGAIISVRPDMLEQLPVSLFAMCMLYSSFDLNGIEC